MGKIDSKLTYEHLFINYVKKLILKLTRYDMYLLFGHIMRMNLEVVL